MLSSMQLIILFMIDWKIGNNFIIDSYQVLFCGKSRNEVGRLVLSSNVRFIIYGTNLWGERGRVHGLDDIISKFLFIDILLCSAKLNKNV